LRRAGSEHWKRCGWSRRWWTWRDRITTRASSVDRDAGRWSGGRALVGSEGSSAGRSGQHARGTNSRRNAHGVDQAAEGRRMERLWESCQMLS
jgi:hypothetical protein